MVAVLLPASSRTLTLTLDLASSVLGHVLGTIRPRLFHKELIT